MFFNTSGDPSTWDFHLQDGSPCIDAGTLKDAPEMDIEGNPRPGGDGKVCMGAYESPDHYSHSPPVAPTRIYVSKNGNNSNGSSWENAYTSITTALSAASKDDIYEIWVAEGTYREGITTIVLGKVNLYGGFSGKETYLSQRNIHNNPTIIEGERIYQCFYNYGMMDGFYVKNGKSYEGGGIFNYKGTVNNCNIYSNSSTEDGGGIYNQKGTVSNCFIYSNRSYNTGGIYNENGTVINSNIFSNSANYCGGIKNLRDSTIINCIVCYNQAINYGGGIHNSYGGYIYNSILYNNSSSENIGGIYNVGNVFNSTLYNNTGGIENSEKGEVINCISWKNGDYDISGEGTVERSCFKEATGTNGNINSDPMLENVAGNISSWDFHLQNDSPCIDGGYADASYNDACLPPGKGGLRNDMGAYGGPYNCWGEFFMNKQDLIDHLLGRKEINPDYKSCADCNTDTIIDIADVVQFMLP